MSHHNRHPAVRTNPIATSLFFISLAVLVVAINLCTGEAFAYHQNLTVSFDDLDVRQESGRVVVDYEIEDEDWRTMAELVIVPRLNLYLPDGDGHYDFAYSQPLEHPSGTLVYPSAIELRGVRNVEFRLVGFHGYYRIDRMRVGTRCGDKVEVAVRRPRHHPHHEERRRAHGTKGPKSTSTAKLIKACESQTDAAGCLELAGDLPRGEAVAVVEACGEHTSWSSNFANCMKRARKIRRDLAATVRACGEATSWNSNMQACLDEATSYRFSAAPVIRACNRATSWDSDLTRCVQQGAGLGYGGSDVVAACAGATSWSSELHRCISKAARLEGA